MVSAMNLKSQDVQIQPTQHTIRTPRMTTEAVWWLMFVAIRVQLLIQLRIISMSHSVT